MSHRPVFALAAVGLMTGTVGFLAAPGAEAVPVPQQRCAFNQVTITSFDAAAAIPGLSLTVNNGSVARRAIVQLSADVGVEPNAEVRVSYSVDGGPQQEDTFGPANLANHQEFYEARGVIAVIPLGPGTHSVTPYWRVSAGPGMSAVMDSRCATIESRTS